VWVYDPDHVAPLRERVVALVCENLDVGPRSVTDSTSFIKDLGAASLDIVELVVEAEEEFEVTIPNKQAEKIGTVGELIGYLLQQRL